MSAVAIELVIKNRTGAQIFVHVAGGPDQDYSIFPDYTYLQAADDSGDGGSPDVWGLRWPMKVPDGYKLIFEFKCPNGAGAARLQASYSVVSSRGDPANYLHLAWGSDGKLIDANCKAPDYDAPIPEQSVSDDGKHRLHWTVSDAACNTSAPTDEVQQILNVYDIWLHSADQSLLALQLYNDMQISTSRSPLFVSPFETTTPWYSKLTEDQRGQSRDNHEGTRKALAIATVASFAIPEIGPVVAAGLTAYGAFALNGGKESSDSDSYDWLEDLKISQDAAVLARLAQQKKTEIFVHFDQYSDGIRQRFKDRLAIGFDKEALGNMLTESKELVCSPMTFELIDFLMVDEEKSKDMALAPTFKFAALDTFMQAVSVWLYAAKLGVLLAAGHVSDPDELHHKSKHPLRARVVEFSECRSLMEKVTSRLQGYIDYLSKALDTLPGLVQARLLSIEGPVVIQPVGHVPDPSATPLDAISSLFGGGGGSTPVMDFHYEVAFFQDHNLKKDEYGKATGGNLATEFKDLAAGLDDVSEPKYQHVIAEQLAANHVPNASCFQITAEARSWLLWIARRYALSWKLATYDKQGVLQSTMPASRKTLANWQSVMDNYTDLRKKSIRR